MQAAYTSETSVNFYQTTRRNNPEDSHLHTRHRWEPEILLPVVIPIPIFVHVASVVIMRSLHEVHEMNACRLIMSVCPSAVFQLENHWMDLDEIWYGGCAIGNETKHRTFSTELPT
jgi:hypothetical protein